MRAVMLEVDERLLEERRRLGLDGRDEMWEGVLHMVPPAGGPHQRLSTRLARAIFDAFDRRGVEIAAEAGLFAADDDYRVPDLMAAMTENWTDRGVDGAAELVVEIRSPRDETTAKLPWYAARVREILVLTPETRAIELYIGRGGEAVLVAPDADGIYTLATIEARLGTVETADGPRLRVEVDGAVTLC